ncbi:MAG: urease subunit beta [Phormidesmis priestleyi Ana]|uniref:Urease subunit beta n=1 Tax=Phormidesmis priestleyi Ana TaxID=1666911 RepID=A0A0P7ZQI0_9CYAN|nr:MAG: urease subunit beta [Phormidesmis priestleyi Ana]
MAGSIAGLSSNDSPDSLPNSLPNSLPTPGAVICEPGILVINAGRETKTIMVVNRGDRPIQVGSHFHFFEVNRRLQFDRAETLGFRLDIPAGTAVRFEPGDSKTVTLVALGGDRIVQGLNNLVNGSLDDPQIRTAALERMRVEGYSDGIQ